MKRQQNDKNNKNTAMKQYMENTELKAQEYNCALHGI